MPRKKILHVAEPFATGVLSFLIDLVRRQIDEYDVTIVWGKRDQTPANVADLFDPRVKLIHLESFKGAMKSVINPKCFIDLRRIYKEEKPDIVHLHSSASGFVGRCALPCNKVPVFYTPHGLSYLSGNGGKLKRAVFHCAEWFAAKRPATIIACSEGEYKETLKLTKRTTFVNNGVPFADLQKYVTDEAQSSDRPKVCTIGRVMLQKNPKLFNEIALLLPDVDFVWIGEGDLENELTAPNVKVTGWLARPEALELLNQSAVFLLPSLWEGLPISLLEAMAMGKVCIVSDVIGNRDVIRSGENGFICHTPEEYANTIRRVIAEPMNNIKEAARDDVEANYNNEKMAEKYTAIYNKGL